MEVPRGSGQGRPWAPAALSLVAGLLGGFAGASIAVAIFDDEPGPPAIATSAAAPELERVAELAVPSVVTVLVQLAPVARGGGIVETTSVGSGVIIDARGFVVTNEHVVRGAERIDIVLHDGEERRGTLVAHDRPFTDLAVLRIEGPGEYAALPLGDSDALRLGEPLVSVGHSLQDFDASVTTGVVSGTHRAWLRDGVVMEDLIQTDAAINHGNSGGALLNSEGELVGVNTTVIRQTESGQAVEGIALAISSRTIREVTAAIIERGHYARPSLGIEYRDISPELAAANGLPEAQGALVTSLGQRSPAARGGLRVEDVIISMGGLELTPDRPYVNTLMRLAIGEPAEVVVLRGADRVMLTLTPVAS